MVPTEIVAAVTEKLAVSCLLPPEVYQLLLEQEPYPLFRPPADRGLISEEGLKPGAGETISCNEVEQFSEKVVNNDAEQGEFESSKRKLLIEEQKECESLTEAWGKAKSNKNGYFLLDGLLFHKDKITGETVKQLVLPKTRIAKVLQIAHESVFGGHLGFRKVVERIR